MHVQLQVKNKQTGDGVLIGIGIRMAIAMQASDALKHEPFPFPL